MEGLLGFLMVAIPIFLVVRHFMKKNAAREQFAALPEDGPMQVSITTQTAEPGSFNSKRYPVALIIDVQISQADWKAIAAAGLTKKVIFQHPGVSKDPYDPENRWDFRVEHLRQKNHIDFGDMIQLEEAKELLVDGLHNLRQHIDQRRGGPKTERMEI